MENMNPEIWGTKQIPDEFPPELLNDPDVPQFHSRPPQPKSSAQSYYEHREAQYNPTQQPPPNPPQPTPQNAETILKTMAIQADMICEQLIAEIAAARRWTKIVACWQALTNVRSMMNQIQIEAYNAQQPRGASPR